MRQLYIAVSILFLLCSVSATDEGKNVEGKPVMELCSSMYCSAKRGYFTESDFMVINTVPYQSVKLLFSAVPTTFVVLITGLRNENSTSATLRICSLLECEEIPVGDDHVRVYEDTNSLAIYIGDEETSVNVEFYIGCEVSTAPSLRLSHKWSTEIGKLSPCWIAIPQLNENFQSQDVATTFTTIDNVELFGNSSLTVKNLLTGENIETFRSNSSNDLFEVVPINPVSFSTGGSNQISLMLLIDINTCGKNDKCQTYSFNLQFVVMTLQDTRCLNRERYCQFGIGKAPENGASCDDDTLSSCPPILDLLDNFITTDDESYSLEKSAKKRSQSHQRSIIRACIKKYKTHERFFFCFKRGGKKKCRNFGNCFSYCKLHQEVLGICNKKGASMMN